MTAEIVEPQNVRGRWTTLMPGGRRAAILCGGLAVMNLGAWTCAAIAFHGQPILLGVAAVTYGLGLRHAVDADHIAAIDNVTRKLMQDGQRPLAVGFFFAIGHSTVVIAATAAVAWATGALANIQHFQTLGRLLSTGVSAAFLVAIAAVNFLIFISTYRSFRQVRAGGAYAPEDMDMLLGSRGPLCWLLRPVFQLVVRSWHMMALGVLFGLGFDTATEVAVFGVSAAQAGEGMPFISVLIFPLLFAAGMSLVDTLDGVAMLGAYDWAFIKPVRKLYYNMAITAASAATAALIGGAEALCLVRDAFCLQGPFWRLVGAMGENLNLTGFVAIAVMLSCWIVSAAIYRLKGLDQAHG